MKDQAVAEAEKELKPILLGKYGVEITDFRGFGVVEIKWEEED